MRELKNFFENKKTTPITMKREDMKKLKGGGVIISDLDGMRTAVVSVSGS